MFSTAMNNLIAFAWYFSAISAINSRPCYILSYFLFILKKLEILGGSP